MKSKKDIKEFEKILKMAGQKTKEPIPTGNWFLNVMQDVRQLSIKGDPQELTKNPISDYINSLGMVVWKFAPTFAVMLLFVLWGYVFNNPFDYELTQMWNNDYDVFLWIEFLGI